MATFKIEVISPVSKILSQDADYAKIRTTEGDMGILPDHIPFVAEIVPGELLIRKDSQEKYYYLSWGFLEISNNTVNILIDEAIPKDKIDNEKERKEAEKIQEYINELKKKEPRDADVKTEIRIYERKLAEARAKIIMTDIEK